MLVDAVLQSLCFFVCCYWRLQLRKLETLSHPGFDGGSQFQRMAMLILTYRKSCQRKFAIFSTEENTLITQNIFKCLLPLLIVKVYKSSNRVFFGSFFLYRLTSRISSDSMSCAHHRTRSIMDTGPTL